MDCVSVRYRTVPVVPVPVVLTCILNTVLNCLKLRQLIENKVFTHRVGVVGKKIFSFRHWHHLGDSPSPAMEGGWVERSCVTYEFPRWFCRLFIFLSIRGASSKTIKTGLNCWHWTVNKQSCLK